MAESWWDFLLGDEEERRAIRERDWWSKGGTAADQRARISRQLATAGKAVSDINRKGGNIFDAITAAGYGLQEGGDEFDKGRWTRAKSDIETQDSSLSPEQRLQGRQTAKGSTGQIIEIGGLLYEIQADGSRRRLPENVTRRLRGEPTPPLVIQQTPAPAAPQQGAALAPPADAPVFGGTGEDILTAPQTALLGAQNSSPVRSAPPVAPQLPRPGENLPAPGAGLPAPGQNLPPRPGQPGGLPLPGQNLPAAGQAVRPQAVLTRQQYDALPPGAMYIGPDGKVRRKEY